MTVNQQFLWRLVLKLRLRLAALLYRRDLQIILFWAGVVGWLGGWVAHGFVQIFNELQWMMGQMPTEKPFVYGLLWWERMLVPTLGGFTAGLILHWGMPPSRLQKSGTDIMEVMVLGDGIMPPRPIVVRCLSSMVSLASGGSIGREGPMVQLTAMLGSEIGQWLRMPVPRLRLLVACGIAAAIAAAYRAPIAGSLFVAEIVLGTIAMESFGPLVFASVVATLTSRYLGDSKPLYGTQAVSISSLPETLVLMGLGVAAGLLAPVFLRLLRASERLFAMLALPIYGRLALGGFGLGLLSIGHPEVWGNGADMLRALLHQQSTWQVLLIMLFCKVLAIAVTVGSGAVGGIFTPTLVLGAILGLLWQQGCMAMHSHVGSDAAVFMVVGMGSLLAATTHAPLMAMVICFEMTLDYDTVTPLMLACVTAYYVAYSLDHNSIYSESLRQKIRRASRYMGAMYVADILHANPPVIQERATLKEIASIFARTQQPILYVVDAENRLQGCIELGDIKDFLPEPLFSDLATAYDIMHNKWPVLTPEMSLNEASQRFAQYHGERLPVIDSPQSRCLLGSVAKADVLLSLVGGLIPNKAS